MRGQFFQRYVALKTTVASQRLYVGDSRILISNIQSMQNAHPYPPTKHRDYIHHNQIPFCKLLGHIGLL